MPWRSTRGLGRFSGLSPVIKQNMEKISLQISRASRFADETAQTLVSSGRASTGSWGEGVMIVFA